MSARPIIKTILAPYAATKAAFFEEKQPERVFLFYIRNYLRAIGLWSLYPVAGKKFYTFFQAMYRLLLLVMLVTIASDFYQVNDLISLGDDLTFFVGTTLLASKVFNLHYNIRGIDQIITEFDELHAKIVNFAGDSFKIHRWQRFFFMLGILFYSTFYMLTTFFFTSVFIAGFYSNQSLIIQAKFPFGLHEPERHPYCVITINIVQCSLVVYSVQAIPLMNQLVLEAFIQTTLNLKFLCVRIRQMGTRLRNNSDDDIWCEFCDIAKLHQQIIRLSYSINKHYYWSFVVQITCSTFMICLSAFVAMVAAKDQPMVALKFQFFMLFAFGELLLLCWMGNMVSSNSLEVATAAYDLHKWYEKSSKFQRDLRFLLQRAQEPLVFCAEPFYPFTFESFSIILRKSYTFYTLLRSVTD